MTETEPDKSQLRTLPTNPSDFEKAIAPYRVMVRPAVVLAKKVCKVLPPKDPMDADETESLEMSYAAAMYQAGGDIDFRITAAMATLGIAIPRLIKYLDDREEKEKANGKIPLQVQSSEQRLIQLQNELKELEQKKRNLEVKPAEVMTF